MSPFKAAPALSAACLLALASSLRADEPKKTARPSILVLALEGGTPAGPAAFALVLRTLGALDAIGGTSVFHPKQVRAVLETHGDRFAPLPPKKKLEAIGPLLGADWALSVTYASLPSSKANDQKASIAIELASLRGGASGSKT